MPQVRDPKTGRYTSGGSSSVGGAAGTNPRIQKAKAVGGGATAGGSNPAGDAQRRSNLAKKYEGADYVYMSDSMLPKSAAEATQSLQDLNDLANHHAQTEKKGFANIHRDAHNIYNNFSTTFNPSQRKAADKLLRDIDKLSKAHLKISQRTGNY